MAIKARWIITAIYTCLLLLSPGTIKAVMVLTDNFNDPKAIQEAYAPNMDAVVLVITENKRGQRIGTGVVIKLPGREDLDGRLILTAAHVIDNGILFVIPNARGASLSNIPPQIIGKLKNAEFNYDQPNETRNSDFGIMLLDTPLSVSAKELPSNRALIKGDILTLVGYGAHFTLSSKTQLPFDGTKRLYRNKLTNVPQNPNYRLFSSNIAENLSFKHQMENYAAPFSGDSGGPVFTNANHLIVRGIMSGMGELPLTHYINVTQQDVMDLLSWLEEKRKKISKAILTALVKEDVELFMQAVSSLNSSISEYKNLRWGSIFNMIAQPKYHQKFRSMFHNKVEAFGHWKNFIISSMQNKGLGVQDKLNFVKVLSLFDPDTALRAASNINPFTQADKQKVGDLVSKIQKHEPLDFHEEKIQSSSKPLISHSSQSMVENPGKVIFQKIFQSFLTALDKENVELFMKAVSSLNSSISEYKDIKWGSIFNMIAQPKYHQKFHSMFSRNEEALGHLKNFIIASMQNRDLEFEDKISFVKVLSLLDPDAALKAASGIKASTHAEGLIVGEIISKIRRNEQLEF